MIKHSIVLTQRFTNNKIYLISNNIQKFVQFTLDSGEAFTIITMMNGKNEEVQELPHRISELLEN